MWSRVSTRQILGVGLVVFLITSFTSIGYHHSDEHWQLLEFANFKLGRSPAHSLASEYRREMRSAFQPAVAYAAITLCESVDIKNPFTIALVLRIISSLLAWLAFAMLVLKSRQLGIFESSKKMLALVSLLLWFIPYTSCRFSNENWSGFLFCFGLLVVATAEKYTPTQFFFSGLLVGLSYLCRFQIVFAILGLLVWLLFIKQIQLQKVLILICGFLLMVGVGFILDKWFYGHFTFTAYNYFYVNLVEGVAASFGVSPWWFYFQMILESAAAPLSVLILIIYFFSLYKQPTHLVHIVVLFFLVGHSLVGHKELRFLFPMVFFLPILLVLGYQKAMERWKDIVVKKWSRLFLRIVVIENSVLLIVIVFFKPAEETTLFNRFVYELASKQSVTIFYLKEDPYQFGDQRQYFYFPKGLTLKKIENEFSLAEFKRSNTTEKILVYDDAFFPSEGVKLLIGKNVYRTFPEWITRFNVGNWVSRAKAWSLYDFKDRQ